MGLEIEKLRAQGRSEGKKDITKLNASDKKQKHE